MEVRVSSLEEAEDCLNAASAPQGFVDQNVRDVLEK